ncbi:DNA translocase FtsK [Brevibacillus sp. SYP-B805]|uniref:FtsK/SpoIIIE family DNA translocase n=1 Tax=Brevibacillus sp. SYP-B805 TaxID=1578199 RepID=UPI0013EC4109|nr:DNA translocase FtsK [Brevibacillus sp. SYP-B805]NGQ94071.1 DNA translocase FtsK [Brevibacillus sp. SYP-B805]
MPVGRERKKTNVAWASVAKIELTGLVVIVLSLIGLLESGWLGKHVLSFFFRFLAGSYDFVIPLLLIGFSLYTMFTRKPFRVNSQVFGSFLLLVATLLWAHLQFYEEITANGRFADQSIVRVTWDHLWLDQSQKVSTTDVAGGMIGALLFALCNSLFGTIGTGLIIGLLYLVGLMFLFNLSYVEILLFVKNRTQQLYEKGKESIKDSLQLLQEESEKRKEQKEKRKAEKTAAAVSPPVAGDDENDATTDVNEPQAAEEVPVAPVIRDFAERLLAEEEQPVSGKPIVPIAKEITFSLEGEEAIFGTLESEEINPAPYLIPSLDMLSRPKAYIPGKEVDHTSNAAKLVQTLKSFGVSAIVSEVHRGPAVTRYEIQPATGVKVSRIVSLTDDLALALAAKDIRIEAPIPGKSAIGIEVPNAEVAVVSLREVLESPQYQDAGGKLTVALGRDISGEPIVADLAKMPHLLVAGATGSGKSVCINSLIMSLLFKARPDEVKLMMVDPKMVELNVYNGIPHLLAPVVTDPRRASVALKKVVAEMERRYNLFAKTGARNIEMYNQQIGLQMDAGMKAAKLPYIVVIVDELADLMMVAPGEVEDAICRLAQMARAAGIHLIIATQRPSVDVITGVIKANIPSRIAFGVSSMADSRTILDMGGAEKLLGRGDMLFLPMGASKPIRVQGAFVSDKEVEEVVRFVKDQQEAAYHEEMIPEETAEEQQAVVDDELFDQAVQIVVEAQSASASLLQRRLRIGYTRAARLIDMMEAQGIVGPYEGSKPREVRVPRPPAESHIS